jgi:hypothetical protein
VNAATENASSKPGSFAPRQDQKKLESTAVHEFVDLFVV